MVRGFGRKEHDAAAHAVGLAVDGEELAKFFLRLEFLQNGAVGGEQSHRNAGTDAEGVQIFVQTLLINGLQTRFLPFWNISFPPGQGGGVAGGMMELVK